MRWLGLVLVLASCGRLGFDPIDDGTNSARCGTDATTSLALGATADGVLCKGEVDTFSVTLAAGEELQTDITTDGPGWLSLEIVDDAQNVRAVRTLEPTLSGFADHDGTYIVRVAGTAATGGTPYHLSVARRTDAYVFMGPAGSDSNDGTFARPVKTFAFALSLMSAGSTLVLLDGDYQVSTVGNIDTDCTTTGGPNGTASAPVRVVALTDRKAGIFGTGLDPVIHLYGACQYWSLEGLHVESKDNNGTVSNGAAISSSGSHIAIKRALVRLNNRYANSHLIEISEPASDVLIEDTEIYDFHRAGLLIYGAQRATARRVFVGSRGNPDIAGGYPSNPTDKGDDGIAANHSVDAIIENTISEGNGDDANDGAANSDCVNTHVLGAIATHNEYGFISSIASGGPQNTIGAHYENCVAHATSGEGFYIRSNMDHVCTNCTAIDTAWNGWEADQISTQMRPGSSAHCINCLAARNAMTGIKVTAQDGGFSVENSDSFGNTMAQFDPMPAPELIAPLSIDPQLGGCLVYLPASSPMRGTGKGGANIGAEVVYRYRDGVLTNTPLWDPETGAFPCGAVIPGINDDPTTSCIGIHERLHVGTNNCALPYPAL